MSNGVWVKIVAFVAVAAMLGMLANLLLDPGMGRADDESRRVTHPSGFSIVTPLGWKASMSQEQAGSKYGESMSVAAQTGIGFPPTIAVTRLPPGATSLAETQEKASVTTFQGKPARFVTRELRNHWQYLFAFTRDEDGGHYEISVTSGVIQDLEHGPIRPFLDSFRPSTQRAPTTLPTTAAVPAG